jgi:hypothetical protein
MKGDGHGGGMINHFGSSHEEMKLVWHARAPMTELGHDFFGLNPEAQGDGGTKE